jgi:hypothetical protein
MRYRLLESKGNHYKVEYQENGGGTLTTASIIEFDIQKRSIQRDGKPASIACCALRLTVRRYEHSNGWRFSRDQEFAHSRVGCSFQKDSPCA